MRARLEEKWKGVVVISKSTPFDIVEKARQTKRGVELCSCGADPELRKKVGIREIRDCENEQKPRGRAESFRGSWNRIFHNRLSFCVKDSIDLLILVRWKL